MRKKTMSHFHLQRPPPKRSWWEKLWNWYRMDFPGRSDEANEYARSLLITVIGFALFIFLTRLFFASRGVPI